MEEMVMGQERIIHAALLGAGTVGSGVYKLVKDLEEEIVSKTGARLVVDKILVRDTTKAREGIPSELLIDRWDEILNDPKIEIVIEVMGGIRPALTWLEEALRAGKQVVTANKDLLAEYENSCSMRRKPENVTCISKRRLPAQFRSSVRCARAWQPAN